MTRPLPLAMLGAALMASASLLGAASAQASDASVVSAIKQAGKQIKETPELKEAVKEVKSSNGKASPEKIEKLFKKVAVAFEGAAKTVETQEASTAKGKQGEKLWLAGVRKEAAGFNEFAKAAEAKQSKQTSKAKKEALDAAGIIVKGAKDVNHGDELLGIK